MGSARTRLPGGQGSRRRISGALDHIHPWNDTQGHSPFVWATIGAIAQANLGLPVTTAVTCPIMRIHPVLGACWPEAAERLEMLEEAIDVIRTLWSGGVQSHRGRHYRVEHARIYDLPDTPLAPRAAPARSRGA
jgi:hypothetical protein